MSTARLKTLHFWFGVLAVIAFLATGQVMYHAYDQLQGLADGPRLLFRSSHLYILLSAIPHLVLAVYLEPAGAARLGRLQLPMSLLLAAATLLMTAAFFVEPRLTGLSRPLTLAGAVALLAAALLAIVLHSRHNRSLRMGRRTGAGTRRHPGGKTAEAKNRRRTTG